MKNQLPNLEIYNATGNIIGIADFRKFKLDSVEKELGLRLQMKKWGILNVIDSIMVLEHSRKADAFMTVFEPQGEGAYGNFSTMCGNGIRAAAAYLGENNTSKRIFKIDTLSGVRNVKKVENEYEVNMGEATFAQKDLKAYMNNFEKYENIYDVPIIDFPNSLVVKTFANANIDLEKVTYSIGLSGSRQAGQIDGEPHLVIVIDEKLNRQEVKELLKLLAKHTVFNINLFPQSINLNLVAVSKSQREVLNTTFERNLGEDSQHAITAACGTGSTIVGAIQIQKYGLTAIEVNNIGGTLGIWKDSMEYVMRGPAIKIM